MKKYNSIERLAAQQQHEKLTPLCYAVYFCGKCVYEHVNYALCHTFKTNYQPKGVIKPIYR